MPKKDIGQVKKSDITKEMRESYLDYAMSVIVSRALPDARDGLKPVQRRILYAMYKMGLSSKAKFRKSATVTGFTMGNFHPHGDAAIYDTLVRMTQDFSLRYPLIKGQGNFGCFTKDTKIRLTDNRSLNFGELIKEQKQGRRHWTFSFNRQTQEVEIAEIKNPRLTRRNEKLIEITLDNNKKVRCTLDHRFMLRDGNYKQAQNLEPGDSLMPGYTKSCQGEDDLNLKGYKMIHQPFTEEWIFIHHLSDKWNLKNKIYEKKDGRIRHHKDFNKLNNNPDNILRIKWKDHWQLHKKIASRRHKNDPEYVKKLTKGRKEYWSKEENRKKQAQRLARRNKKMWQDPEYRKRRIKALKEMWQDPEYRKRMKEMASNNLKRLWQREDFQKKMSRLKSKQQKERWQKEEYRKKMSQVTKKWSAEVWSDPKHREFVSKFMKKMWQDPEYRERQSQVSKELWQDPEYRENYSDDHFQKMAQKLWEDPKIRELHRKKAKEQWQNPEFRKKMSNLAKKQAEKRLEEDPDCMKRLAAKAKKSLKKKWRKESYKQKVIRSKILGHVKSILEERGKVTPQLYEKERTNNGVPTLENALENYFDDFSEIVEKAQNYNHKVVATRILDRREDVYDLTVEPHHNFLLEAGVFVHNSIDKDPAAAARYTECKMAKIAEEMLSNIEEDTVNFVDNYDGRRQEPQVLPAQIPQLLLNGTMGIAVGMASNIPPHNLGELVEAVCFLIDNPEAELEDLMKFIKGPDFPTGGVIYNRDNLEKAYQTGRGGVVIRGRSRIEKNKIIIEELPYQITKAKLVKKIAQLIKDEKIKGAKTVRDESDREGLRVVVEIKQGTPARKVLNKLFNLTRLQTKFHFNMVALRDGLQPARLSLRELLQIFIKHRREVVERRSKYRLKIAQARLHILEGLKKALDHIDEIIKTIKQSEDKKEAAKNLKKDFGFSDKQTESILKMRLQALAGLERQAILDELEDKKNLIEELEALLADPQKILNKIKAELQEVKDKYGNKRRTQVNKTAVKKFAEEDLVPNKETVITLSQGGYIKRVNPRIYKVQKRGGKGIVGMKTKGGDRVEHFLSVMSHDKLLFFTNLGRVFQIKAFEVPEGSRIARGRNIVNFLELDKEEKVTALMGLPDKKFLAMATKDGKIKKTPLKNFKKVRSSGLIAIKLNKGDELRWVKATSGQDQIILLTKQGQAIRFKEGQVRSMGRTASGVKGVDLSKGDEVIDMEIVEDRSGKEKSANKKEKLLTISKNGYGKQTPLEKYRAQKRGGKGLKTAKLTDKTGSLAGGALIGSQKEDLVIISAQGQVIRIKAKGVSTMSRNTQGVRIMKLNKNDKVVSLTRV